MLTMNFRPCLVIPIYNHKETIAQTIAAVERFSLPCLVVNDGSDGDTVKILNDIAVAKSWVNLVHFCDNQGKGRAVCEGLIRAHQQGFTHALQIDADGQHDSDDIPKFIALAKRVPSALILGNPTFDDSIPRNRYYGRYITHFCVWIETLSFTIRDTMCGFRVYPLESTKKLISSVSLGQRMEFDTDIAVRLYWEGVPIINVKTHVRYYNSGISNFRLFRDNTLISAMHIRLVCGMLRRFPRLLFRRNRTDQLSDRKWFTITERGAPWGLKFMLLVYRFLGRRFCTLLLYPLVGYFFVTGRQARNASQEYLKQLYSTSRGKKSLKREPKVTDSYFHFIQFGKASLDKFSSWLGDIKRSQVAGAKPQAILDLVKKKQGAVLIGSHLGNIEILRAVIDAIPEVRVYALIYMKHAKYYNDLLKKTNARMSLQVIPADTVSVETSLMLKEHIERGHFIAMLGDRLTEGASERTSVVPFLGRPAAFPQGPFLLASLLECPVLLLFCFRFGMSSYEIHVEPFSERLHFPRKTREDKLRECITRYARRLEEYCYRAPYQWFNFYSFWKRY